MTSSITKKAHKCNKKIGQRKCEITPDDPVPQYSRMIDERVSEMIN